MNPGLPPIFIEIAQKNHLYLLNDKASVPSIFQGNDHPLSPEQYNSLCDFANQLVVYNFLMSMIYDFNPRSRANHVERRYLGQPGSCNVMIGTEEEDPKYKGPCGKEHTAYTDCLIRREFHRVECRPAESEVISCEQRLLGDQSKQIQILANWRKKKGIPVKSSYVPYKLFGQGIKRLPPLPQE